MRYLIGIFLLVLFVTIAGVGWFYPKLWKANLPATLPQTFVYIPTNSSLEDLAAVLAKEAGLKDEQSFLWLANREQLMPRAGRFRLAPNMNNQALVTFLAEEKQAPIRLILNSKRTKEDIAAFVSKHIEADSAEIIATLNDSLFLKEYERNVENAVVSIIPNTYEFFWNTSGKEFYKRMVKEHQRFWTEERLAKADSIGLSDTEVYILASIVEKETNKNAEKSRIAGVYLNRLRQDWRLDADPAIVFAWRDFTIRRVLKKHCEIDSPYNSYIYKGLPPGPICMPSIASIDHTLAVEEHAFMFFCAKADKSGYHNFAESYKAHRANAREYHKQLRLRDLQGERKTRENVPKFSLLSTAK